MRLIIDVLLGSGGVQGHQVNEAHRVNEVHQVNEAYQVNVVHQVNEYEKERNRNFLFFTKFGLMSRVGS